MLESCGMSELPSTGNSLTCGGKRGNLWIQSKLDRAFGNKDWVSQFPASNQAFLAKRGSDHRPVVIKLLSSQDSYRGSFRFDKQMLHKPLVQEAIQLALNSPHFLASTSVSSRLRQCRKALSVWKKKRNSANSQVRIIKLQDGLEKEESSIPPSLLKMSSLKKDLLMAYKDEENFWKQKKKVKMIGFALGMGALKCFMLLLR